MKGRFTYHNQIFVSLMPAIIAILLLTMYIYFTIAVILLGITVILKLLLDRIPCRYQAGQERVDFQILWRTHRFPYNDIRAVKTEVHYGGKSRFDDTFSVIAELTLRTDDGVHVFCSRHSFSISDQIKAPEQFKEQMAELDFIQLGRYIESQISPQKEVRG